MKRGRVGFLKPKTDDDVGGSGWQEDRPDLDTNSQTSFVYNPFQNQDLERQRARLPIAAYRDNLLYLLEKHQVQHSKRFSCPVIASDFNLGHYINGSNKEYC